MLAKQLMGLMVDKQTAVYKGLPILNIKNFYVIQIISTVSMDFHILTFLEQDPPVLEKNNPEDRKHCL